MFKFHRLLPIILFVTLSSGVNQDRPVIKTSNGDLYLMAAYDQNIRLQPNGPKSKIFIAGVNILDLNLTDTRRRTQSNNDLESYLNGPNGILSRLDRLENDHDHIDTPSDVIANISILWRRVNRLTNRVSHIQTLLSNIGLDNCQSSPCMHGGTCLNLVNSYHCLCTPNWEGTNCDVDVNECRNFAGTDLGCQNGATCLNRQGTYECLCRSGWFGVHCTRKQKDCSGGNYEMCGHGTCIPVTSGAGITCLCNQGWTTNGTGVECLTDVNECESSQGPRCSVNPRVDCINLPGSFRCGSCPPGYEGDGYVCSDIDECLTNNGGCSSSPMVACHNTIGSRICGTCPPGFQGDGVTCTYRGSCNINHGGCHPSAQCIENGGFGGQVAQCICPDDMDGDGVGINGCYVPVNHTQGCDTNPCGIHGHCHPLQHGYSCICFRGYGGAHCNSPVNYCASIPCLNGGTCRADASSPKGFRCECTAQYSGDFCQAMIRSCSGLLHQEEGSIVYPPTNTTYSHNSKCAWVIQTDDDKVINVTFSRFNLEQSDDCRFDFLQIHDGRSTNSPHIGRFCGNRLPNGGNIISSHNTLYLWFRSDQNVAKDGFALHWTSVNPICGGEVNATGPGRISSPGSPGKYPPNRDCYWHLYTTLSKKIQLQFFSFDLAGDSNCSSDYLAIYDGRRDIDRLMSKICGSAHPAPVESLSPELLLHFHSDAQSSGNGFQIAFAPAPGVPGCGGLFTTDKAEILSPSYNDKYLSNLLCEYKIQTSVDTKIHISFKSFDLENSVMCRYDYIKIYDGASSDAKLVGKFCGSTYPLSYTSTSNKLLIVFKTDHNTAGRGFKIAYEAICQQTIIGDSGFIKSPSYPFAYPINKMCEYVIQTTPGKAIQLTFQDFDLEDNRHFNCIFDYVEVRDGANLNATRLGKFCGQRTPPTLTSTHNYMYLKFKSDVSTTGTGFYANFTTLNTECGGIYRDQTGLIVHPSDHTTYKNDQSCTWLLIAPEGSHIKLTWNSFELEVMPSCRADYVELVEIDEDNNHISLGKFCGTNFPPAWTTSSNNLMIKFKSDLTTRHAGFSVSYTFLDDKMHCNGMYMKSHGIIYSPGWPKRYPTNKDCTWTIMAPKGQQIALNISQFDLERPMRNNCDYGDFLEIRNGGTDSSPLIGKFCGSFESKILVSHSNSIYLHFHSDAYIGGNGFKLEWDNTVKGCGGTLTSPAGSITSPNYPSNYHDNAECFYKIITSAGSRIQLRFRDLQLETTHRCRDDFVEIYDGKNVNGAVLGKYCVMSQITDAIQTSSNYAFIKFRSDFYIGAKGFLLEYNTVCHNNITGSHGVIESPGYPDDYPLGLNCLWTITVPRGNKINVTFTHFEVMKMPRRYQYYYQQYLHRLPEGLPGRALQMREMQASECTTDYLQMAEALETNTNKLCGTDLPALLTTKSNTLHIKFNSGNYISRTGFRLEWARYGCGGYTSKRYGTIFLDSSLGIGGELECEWIIEGPPGSQISVTITDIYVTDSKNCTMDAVEFYNGPNVQTPLVTKVCHGESTSIQSTSNFMFVRFIKRSSLMGVRFGFTYDSFVTGCGGRISALTGVISSKNYPQNYDNNLDCMWTLEVPTNHRVLLTFMDFDLFQNGNANDCGDSIKIYEGIYVIESNYTQRICPDTQVSRIFSKNSILGVQFTSDSTGTAKGFKANFTVTCGAIITAHYDGIITNDKFVRHLDSNCTWTILAPNPDQKITLTITHMSIPKDYGAVMNRTCPSSFLRIYDGDDEEAPMMTELCGNKIPAMLVSQGSALTIQFGTYSGDLNGQFSAHYTTMSRACGGTLTSEEGSIASPNYPMSYPVSSNCEWTLQTSPGNKVYVFFEDFDLEYSDNCNEDYLEVRENDGVGHLLGIFCGTEIPTNITAASKLYIKFHSDSDDVGKGFLMHYGFVHGNFIVGLKSGEIASPLFPNKYVGEGDYSWRIIVNGTQAISLNIESYEIPAHGNECNNYLAIYDGYDEEAPLLEKLCGWLVERKHYETSSDIVFVRLYLGESNTGSSFFIRWEEADISETTESNLINCGSNTTQLVTPGQLLSFTSPNYPRDYDDNLNCEWIFKSSPQHRLNLKFIGDINLEETETCHADYISVYSSDTGVDWAPVKEKICQTNQIRNVNFNATDYLKVTFTSDVALAREGFSAQVSSICGGLITESSGFIEPILLDFPTRVNLVTLNCEWTVRVRPGRTIRFNFEHFNITNNANDCQTYVTLRNGDSVNSPFIGSGRYCGYDHENRDVTMETSGYTLFVTYEIGRQKRFQMVQPNGFQNFRIRFEEKSFECGAKSKLDPAHRWEIISSPRYPSVPTPYSECIWVFTGPPGEILRIDFTRVDLERNGDCSLEFLEIHDGSTNLSPMIGEKICGKNNPGTIKTTSNNLFIKYLTDLPSPSSGFQANVSIDVCGGTIVSDTGEIVSPEYPLMIKMQPGTVCEWRIIAKLRQTLVIDPKDINLPDSESRCGTKITIEEKVGTSNVTLYTYCNNYDRVPVESSSNELTVKLHIGNTAQWATSSSYRGFRFTFNTSRPVCGDALKTSEGFLQTPNYPRETSVRLCQWFITVPHKDRRIRLELLDSNLEKHRIDIFNDLRFQNPVESLSTNDLSSTITPLRVFESTGNTLSVFLFLYPHASTHRFKAKFSSNDEALCGGNLDGINGRLESPDLQRSYLCTWHYEPGSDISIDNSTEFKTLYITARVNSSTARSFCRYADPKVTLRSQLGPTSFVRNICGNTEVSLRIPSTSLDIIAAKGNTASFYFNLQWKLQPCGGIVRAGINPINVLNVPASNDTLDCTWLVKMEGVGRVEIKLEGTFQFECSEEFVSIVHTPEYSSSLGEYCKNKMQDNPIVTAYPYLYVQYHTKATNSISIRLSVKSVTGQCGGLLRDYDRIFETPNFPNGYSANIECSWEIKANVGNRISLAFVDRFAIEKTTNCTKDAVFIYDWIDDRYVEIAKICGRNLPPIYNSTANRMKIVLRTDNDINLDGFKVLWTPICGGTFVASAKEKFLYSPGYPDQYPAMANCVYEITHPDSNINIIFHDFELEGSYPSCEYDNVTIYSHYYYSSTYCGLQLPPPMRKDSSISITFKSDRFTQKRGFKISYSIYNCGGVIKQPALISSGNEEDDYEDNLNCTWIVEAPANKIAIIKFQEFELEAASCYYDHVSIFDGPLIDEEKRLALLCGHLDCPTVIQSKNNKMVVRMITDNSKGYKGFKAQVYFSYSNAVGCGGQVIMSSTTTRILKSPHIGGNVNYENFLDCHWSISAPEDYIIQIEFTSFHIAPCVGINQTALGYSKCDCDYVEIRDGLNPNSNLVGSYCGHTIPPALFSSGNVMSVRLSTDGEEQSGGFEARLSVKLSECGQSLYDISLQGQTVKSPGYDRGLLPRGLRCVYRFNHDSSKLVRVTFKTFDIRPGLPEESDCNKDKLTIIKTQSNHNVSQGKDFIIDSPSFTSFDQTSINYYMDEYLSPSSLVFCGNKKPADLYLTGYFAIVLETNTESDSLVHKGVEISLEYSANCPRNHTELYGRIKYTNSDFYYYDDEGSSGASDCYTLITVPENYTISAYFLRLDACYSGCTVEVFDGNVTTAPRLLTLHTSEDTQNIPNLFTNGRYLLFHSVNSELNYFHFELDYMATDKGRGCGGKLHDVFGKLSSPLYPEVYRQKSTCEWELETPQNTHLILHFEIFDMGRACEQNYLQLVDRTGNVVSSYCEEAPADYTSPDNYVKIVFTTTMNNGGTGWVAEFISST